MSFTNLYYKRTAGTPKACYVCFRPTTTVLATTSSVDFLYACDGHLTDPGFASPISESGDPSTGGQKPSLSAEEIQKVKDEWEEKQRRKKEKEKQAKDKEGKDKEKDGEKSKEKEKEIEKKAPSPPPTSSPSTSTPAARPRYTLHRQIFTMRLAEHRRRRQTAQAKEIAPKFPSAPRNSMPGTLTNSGGSPAP